jgi:hypothetical protein
VFSIAHIIGIIGKMGIDVNDNGLNGKEAIKVNLPLNKVPNKQAFCNFSAEISKTGPLCIRLLRGLIWSSQVPSLTMSLVA